jgi:hypothetical protein
LERQVAASVLVAAAVMVVVAATVSSAQPSPFSDSLFIIIQVVRYHDTYRFGLFNPRFNRSSHPKDD